MTETEKKQLKTLAEKRGLRTVLNVLAELVQEHIDKEETLALDEEDVIELGDLPTAKANLEGSLF